MQPSALAVVERRLTRSLSAWSLASVIGGLALALWGKRRGRHGLLAFGRQTVGWGVVDAAIAGVGAMVSHRRGPLDEPRAAKQARSLRRTLLVNAAADVGYVAGGAVVARRARAGRPLSRLAAGDGLAMVLQGLFLLVLDLTHARRLR